MGELEGKVALITGAGSGTAEASAKVFVQQFGRIDTVLNIAGVGIGVPMLETTQEVDDFALDAMLRGVFFGTAYGIRAMQRTGTGGSIVNWSPLAGLNAAPGSSLDSAAKAGAIASTKAAAATGIRFA